MQPTCCICQQIAGRADGDLLQAHLGGPYERRVQDVSDDFALIPSIGSLVRGHLLLCPRSHARSCAQLGIETLRAADGLLDRVVARLSEITGAPVQLFEHGDNARSDRVSCSVAHAHLHLVPCARDLWPPAERLCHWFGIDSLSALSETVGEGEYLALRGLTSGWQVSRPSEGEGHPSQLLRRVVAEAVGMPGKWNWRRHPQVARTRASWEIARMLPAA